MTSFVMVFHISCFTNNAIRVIGIAKSSQIILYFVSGSVGTLFVSIDLHINNIYIYIYIY